jgi:hypothetical protein
MTLPHATKLVRVGQKGYLWTRHYDRGIRECEANPIKHIDCPITSKELYRQEVSSPRIWSGWPRIPSSLPNDRCTLLRHQRKANLPLHRSVSYHQQVWVVILQSGATIKAIRSSQCVSHLPTQKMSEAPDWCCCWRYHPIDIKGLSYQDFGPTRPNHPQQDHTVLQGSMEWSLGRWSHVEIWRLPTIQVHRVSSV